MENVLANIESQVSPAAISAGANPALKVGHVSVAEDLYKAFCEDDNETTVKMLQRIAGELDCETFKAECKKAQGIADSIDKASGFVPKADAKGAEKYGPKRVVINTRLSEAKNIFGVAKIDPDALKEKGYWAAVQAARQVLTDKGIKWDGEPVPTDEQKAVRKETAKQAKAVSEVLAQAAKQGGISTEDLIEKAKERALENSIADACELIEKKFGKGEVTLSACVRLVSAIADPMELDLIAQDLWDLAMVRRLEEVEGKQGQ